MMYSPDKMMGSKGLHGAPITAPGCFPSGRYSPPPYRAAPDPMPPPPRRCMPNPTMNLMIPFLLLLPLPTMSQYYHNRPLTNASGIFYNKKGIAQITNSKLTLLTHINITYLNDATGILHEYLIKTQGICTVTVKDPSPNNHISYHCERTLKLIENELDEIDRKRNILQQLSQQSSIRKRRGLINGVSYALKWIFGVPDANDAQYYEDSIKALMNNNQQTQTLLKSQVQVIASTIKNFNNSISSLKNQEAAMNENVKRVNEFTIQTNSYITRLSMETTITQQITSLLALTSRITREYNQYIEAINLAEHNIISPLIITPEILLEELKGYKGELNLIMKPEPENIRPLYKLIQLQMITSKDIIIFALNIPLVKKMVFDVYELIPLPIQHNHSFFYSYIIPQNNYILLSQSKTQVTFLKELSDCIEYLDQLYICHDLHTSQVTTQPICEVNMLSPHIKEIPDDCETRTVKATIETWKYISNNEWIYVLQNPTTLTVICNENHMEDVILEKTGIIRLQNNCRGYTNLFALETNYKTNKNITYYVPNINILNDDCCILTPHLEKIKSQELRTIHLANMDLSDLKYANKKLNEFEDIITKQMNQPFVVTYAKWYTIALGVIGVILIFIILKNCSRCLYWIRRLCCSTTHPTTGQTLPPFIKNFVNCNFDSSVTPRETATYNIGSRYQPSAETPPTVTEDEESPQPVRYMTRSRVRKSTTPL